MYLGTIGQQIRQGRLASGLTQAALARSAGLSRTTVNQLESGSFPEIGVNRLLTMLKALGLDLAIVPSPTGKASERDYLELACTSANVSYRDTLTPHELARALATGKVPEGRRPHMRVVFDEVPPAVFDGMVRQVGAWCPAGKLQGNIAAIAGQINSSRRRNA